MRVKLRAASARRIAASLYPGESLPISVERAGDRTLDVEWWRSNPQDESSRSGRHHAALALYLELAKSSKIVLPPFTFPARMELEDQTIRPDKGVMKVFLDEGLVEPRMLESQLVFDATVKGMAFLEDRTARAATGLE